MSTPPASLGQRLFCGMKALGAKIRLLQINICQRNAIAAAVVGGKPTTEGSFVVSIDPVTELWAGPTLCGTRTVLFNQHIYTAFRNIRVYRLNSETSSSRDPASAKSLHQDVQPVHTISIPANDDEEAKCIYGIRVFAGEVFFYTMNDIYALDADGATIERIAHVDDHLAFGRNGFVVLKRDSDEFSIGVQIGRAHV